MIRRGLLAILLQFWWNRNPGPMGMRIGSWMLRNVPGMLTCEQVEAFIFDYYEGRLSERERKQFEMHLAMCPMCRVHFDGYVRAIELGRKVFEEDETPDEMPPELAGAILLAIEGDDP